MWKEVQTVTIPLYYCLISCRKELGDVTPHNIRQLKKLNSVVFPISYTDKVSIKNVRNNLSWCAR